MKTNSSIGCFVSSAMAIAACAVPAQFATAQSPPDPARQWGQWRGPEGNGVATHGDPPVEWSETKNIRWKVATPGQGLSTPIVWGDRVYLQTAIPTKPTEKGDEDALQPDAGAKRHRGGSEKDGERARHGDRRQRGERGGRRGPGGGRHRWMGQPAPTDQHRFTVVAFDRHNGRTVWTKTVREEVPHEGSHRDGSLAPASPVTDGEHLYAYFGSRGLYCLNMDGTVVWEKDLGDMTTRNGFGEGSSPVLHGDTIVVNWDHEGDSFIVALDKKTGAQRWRRERDEVTSWSTPLILDQQPRPQVVVSATNRVRSYDLASGETVWECGGLGLNCTPTPVAASELLFAMSGYRDPALLAIRHKGASGDLTGSSSIVWRIDKGTSYVPSPLLYGDALYFLGKNSGILSCYDAKTGKQQYDQQRLEDINGVYASPVGAAGRVYIAGRNGTTYVLKRGPTFEVLAVNKLNDSFTASPAIAGKELYLRGGKHLYCIAID